MKKAVFPTHTSNFSTQKLRTTKIIEERYEIKDECLGKGSFGKVSVCWDRIGQETIAIKEISKEMILQKINLSKSRQNYKQFYINSIKNEANIMQLLNHQNILKMYGHTQTDKGIYFYLEYCDQQTLASLLAKNSFLDYKTALPIMKKIVKGCAYLHQLRIAHRDLKPENILISKGQPKISDFGFAITLQNEEQVSWVSQFRVGTEAYMAPQVFQSEILTLKSDVWSLGITFYKMLTGKFPFQVNFKTNSKYKYEYTKHIWIQTEEFIPNFLKDIIQKMLIYNYNQRPSMSMIQSLLSM